MTHKLDADDLFIHRIQQHCAEARLNFFLIEPAWVETFYQSMQEKKVWTRVLLNFLSDNNRPNVINTKSVKFAWRQITEAFDRPGRPGLRLDKRGLHRNL